MKVPADQRQREAQLVAEWLGTLPPSWPTATRLRIGHDPLAQNGKPLPPHLARAFRVWFDWVDARVVTPTEVWLVEGKLIATGQAYGEVLGYADEYPESDDYARWKPRSIVPVVVAQASRSRLASLFGRLGVRTITFAPTFSLEESLGKLFPRIGTLDVVRPGEHQTVTGKTFEVGAQRPSP